MPYKIDRDWFMERLEARNKSVRGLARHLDVAASGISRMLSGQRRMKMEEANKIASFLGASVTDVLAHAGVSTSGAVADIMLLATIDESGRISDLEEPTILPQDVVDRAQAAISHHRAKKINAIQVRAETGPLAVWDDAVMLYIGTDLIEAAAIGTLSVCATKDGDRLLCRIEKARKTGEATVRVQDGVEDIDLAWAAPVVAIIP